MEVNREYLDNLKKLEERTGMYPVLRKVDCDGREAWRVMFHNGIDCTVNDRELAEFICGFCPSVIRRMGDGLIAATNRCEELAREAASLRGQLEIVREHGTTVVII